MSVTGLPFLVVLKPFLKLTEATYLERRKSCLEDGSKADVIIGPVGIVIADSLGGEVTPKMAKAVGQSNAARVLIPVNRCDNMVAGVGDVPLTALIRDAAGLIQKALDNKEQM